MLDQVEIQVSAGDIDELGHVNNARFVEYFERGRVHWYNSIALFRDPSFHGRIGTVVVSMKINFRRESFRGDRLAVRTDPRSKGNRSFVLYQEILNDTGELVADAEVTSVLMDLAVRSSIDLPPVLAEQFTADARVQQPGNLKEK